jgi:hypothetical protein
MDAVNGQPEMQAALLKVARRFAWDHMSVDQLGLLLWALLRYYVLRLT